MDDKKFSPEISISAADYPNEDDDEKVWEVRLWLLQVMEEYGYIERLDREKFRLTAEGEKAVETYRALKKETTKS